MGAPAAEPVFFPAALPGPPPKTLEIDGDVAKALFLALVMLPCLVRLASTPEALDLTVLDLETG